MKFDRIALDALNPPDLIAADIIRADQNLNVRMVLRGILDGDVRSPFFAAFVKVVFSGSGNPLFAFFRAS